MRCSMCGHESPAGSSFCLNCGSSLAAPAFAQTPPAPAGLPAICPMCRGENPPGMKFCRSCGTAIPGGPVVGAPGVPPPAAPMIGGAPGVAPMGAPHLPPPPMPPPMAAPGAMPPPGPLSPPGAVAPSGSQPASAPGGTVACPRCGTATPIGFAYCQQCGLHMQALQPTDPGAGARAHAPSSPGPVGTAPNARPLSSPALAKLANVPIDPQGATLAADNIQAGSILPPAARAAPVAAAAAAPGTTPDAASWGTAVLVNRDGSDGQRFALSGEYNVVGRVGADIAFEDDRFLARQHARIERAADGAIRVHPLDTLNGVFRKADLPVELVDGMTILVGREVLRYERVDEEEMKIQPLVRHGVALFGSPPREPWGRLFQIVPSGGYRDVRHLAGNEVVLGREEGDIVFRDDAFMSRRHAAVTWDGRRAQITDLGSSNGTFVRLGGPTPIKHGDHLRMGDQLLRIELGK